MSFGLATVFCLFCPWLSAGEFVLPESSKAEIRKLFSGITMMTFSPELGWTMRPAMKEAGKSDSNSAGMRAEKDYSPKPARGVLRVAAFGDSFVYGDGVGFGETWEAIISSATPDIEVLNYGVPAYGLDQSWLRFRKEGMKFSPKAVIMGFLPNTIFRNLGVFRPFFNPQIGMPFSKPRFKNNKGVLELVPNPLKSEADYKKLMAGVPGIIERIGRDDVFYQRAKQRIPPLLESDLCYHEDCGGLVLAKMLLKGFVEEVKAGGASPVLLIFCDKDAFISSARGKGVYYSSVLDFLRRGGYDYLDTGEALLASGAAPNALFSDTDHYTAYANELVARALQNHLKNKFMRP